MARGEITHVEFPADDAEPAKRFFGAVAGWESSKMYAAVDDPEGNEVGLWEVPSGT